MPVRTYLDTGVLIAAGAGKRREQQTVLEIFEDPDRIFLRSSVTGRTVVLCR